MTYREVERNTKLNRIKYSCRRPDTENEVRLMIGQAPGVYLGLRVSGFRVGEGLREEIMREEGWTAVARFCVF